MLMDIYENMNKLLLQTVADIAKIENDICLSKGVRYVKPTMLVMNKGSFNIAFATTIDVDTCVTNNLHIITRYDIPYKLIMLL